MNLDAQKTHTKNVSVVSFPSLSCCSAQGCGAWEVDCFKSFSGYVGGDCDGVDLLKQDIGRDDFVFSLLPLPWNRESPMLTLPTSLLIWFHHQPLESEGILCWWEEESRRLLWLPGNTRGDPDMGRLGGDSIGFRPVKPCFAEIMLFCDKSNEWDDDDGASSGILAHFALLVKVAPVGTAGDTRKFALFASCL